MEEIWKIKRHVEWTGHYWTTGGECHPLQFDHLETNSEDKKVFGHGKDVNGIYGINGFMAWTGELKFWKEYRKGNDTVIYEGVLKGPVIEGTWKVGMKKNKFEIRMKTTHWKGFFIEDGQKQEMEVDLSLENGKKPNVSLFRWIELFF